jgi:hypothetical protein
MNLVGKPQERARTLFQGRRTASARYRKSTRIQQVGFNGLVACWIGSQSNTICRQLCTTLLTDRIRSPRRTAKVKASVPVNGKKIVVLQLAQLPRLRLTNKR